jgi:hypothetical protein
VESTLKTSGEDVKNTLETSGEDVESTLKTSGEHVKNTLDTSGFIGRNRIFSRHTNHFSSGEDANLHSKTSGEDANLHSKTSGEDENLHSKTSEELFNDDIIDSLRFLFTQLDHLECDLQSLRYIFSTRPECVLHLPNSFRV